MSRKTDSGYTLTAAEKAVLHSHHAVQINLDWQTCPICLPIWREVECIVAEHVERLTTPDVGGMPDTP